MFSLHQGVYILSMNPRYNHPIIYDDNERQSITIFSIQYLKWDVCCSYSTNIEIVLKRYDKVNDKILLNNIVYHFTRS